MLDMQPYRVIMKGISPVVISGIAPSLDGILYEALSQVLATESSVTILTRLREILLFNKESGVFHASSLTFAITPEHGVNAVSSIRCDCLRDEKLSSSMFNPRVRGGRFIPLMLKGGPTKRRLTSRPAYASPYYAFDFVGVRESVLHLLTMTFVGIGYDVFSAANGEFADVHIIPLDADSSIAVQGAAMRPVPVQSKLQGLNGFSPLIPPYFGGERTMVTYPEPVRIRLLSDLV
ncbi:hypothetical protein EL09_15175 [Salmonella enterica subsp. enterica]|nr:hypothetical protein [Salmonella enterica subsp. enterica]MIF51056.1 hypothetical protein [Salmonella enterica subsp. enterica]